MATVIMAGFANNRPSKAVAIAYSLAWDSDHAQQHAGAGAAGLVCAPPGGPADLEALPGFRAGL